jgi:hypothetical protein
MAPMARLVHKVHKVHKGQLERRGFKVRPVRLVRPVQLRRFQVLKAPRVQQEQPVRKV